MIAIHLILINCSYIHDQYYCWHIMKYFVVFLLEPPSTRLLQQILPLYPEESLQQNPCKQRPRRDKPAWFSKHTQLYFVGGFGYSGNSVLVFQA